MKFPKSVHPEGWLNHIDRSKESTPVARPDGQPLNPLNPLKPRMTRPSAKIRATDPLGTAPVGYVPPQPMAAAIPPIHATTAPAVAAPGTNPNRRSNSAMPWVVGVGAGVVLLGVAATMSRQFTGNEAPALPPTVVGEATTPVAPASSPEDTLLAEAPPAAGVVTPAAEPHAEAVAPAPVEPAPKLAAAPAPAAKVAETPKPVEAPRVAQAEPVTRTLTPQPQTWVLSQAEPPAAALRDTTPVTPVTPQPAAPVATQQPVAPVALPPVTETPPVTQPQPEVQAPVVAQQTPPVTPPVANPEDTGITIKVREALASDTTLAAVPIAVSTDHGVVKLEGQAPDSLAKERATVVAASAAGVRGVDNRLTLPPVTVGAVTQNSGS